MECDICSKDDVGNDDFFCTSCARSSIYLSRLEVARILLENEQLNQEVTKVVDTSTQSGPIDPSLKQAHDTWEAETLASEKVIIKGKIQDTRSQTSKTEDEVEALKLEIARRKENLKRRKNAMATVDRTIPERRSTSIDTLSEVREKGNTSIANVSARSASNRAFLCREAAALLRLRQKKKHRSGTISDQYTITGLLLPDLKEINNLRCTDLTASLTSAARLLVLVAFYLGIRLPAEITIPHRDYPLPTINTPSNSYLGQKVAFPGSGSIHTAPSSPFSSKHDVKGPYRPRPLFIGSDDKDERVAQFAKRDSTAFNFFVEGVSLLAWDIAWLLRSQGFSQGTDSWEDICDIGRNLHQLILGQPQSPALLRVLSSRDAQRRQRHGSSGSPSPVSDASPLSFAKLGQASHLSAHAFLGQASFNEQSRSWKYGKYNTISDALKKMLVTEMNNAEWELLQEGEYLDGGEQFDEAVIIKARNTEAKDFDDARSIMSMRTHLEEQIQQMQPSTRPPQPPAQLPAPSSANERDQGKTKSTSGWMKLKSRNDDFV